MFKKVTRITPVFIAALVLAACAPKPKFIKTPFTQPQKIVLLPMTNQSNDLRAPEYVRKMFEKYVGKRGYEFVPSEQVDETLRTKLGINEGGQLNSVTMKDISAAIPEADAFVYGDIIDFKFMNLGIYVNKYAEANWKMMDKTGELIWEDQRKASEKKLGLSTQAIIENAATGVAEKMIGNMMSSPLKQQVIQITATTARTLPKRVK